jgi:hypothetical protein
MKKRLYIVILVISLLSFASCFCCAKSNDEDTISLHIATDKDIFKINEKVFLNISICNVGNNDIRIPNGFIVKYKFLGIEVRNEKNELVSEKQRFVPWGFVPKESFMLQSENFFGKKIDLTSFYDFDCCGSYSIRGFYDVSNSDDAYFGESNNIKDCWNGSVKSNEIKISIIK